MVPGQAALVVNRVGRTDGAVGGQLDGAPLHERARRHDDLRIVAGHIAGDGVHIAVHRCGGLDALAEGEHPLGAFQLDALDDVVPLLACGGNDAEAEGLVHGGGEHRALDRAGDDIRREEEALIERGHQPEVRADLLPQSGRGETVGAAVHALLRTGDVAADGRKTAAGVLDEAADDHVRADVARLDRLDELAVAVIDHDRYIGLDRAADSDGLADLRDRERRTRLVALGALDVDELRFRRDGGADGGKIKAAVVEQIDLPVAYAVFGERAGRGADADDLLERIVGLAGDGEQLVAGQQVRAQRDGERMGAAGDLRANQRGLGVEGVGVDAL